MEKTKICFKCGELKNLSDYYKHPAMGDGHLNKCKKCTKTDTKKRSDILISTPEGLDKERERHREKYHRLNYLEKHKPTHDAKKLIMERYKNKYPEKIAAKSNSGNFPTIEGVEKHHWSYNKEHYKDVIYIASEDHNTAHRFIVYDQERMMYRKLTGELLDTRISHEEYINSVIERK